MTSLDRRSFLKASVAGSQSLYALYVETRGAHIA